MPHSILFDYTKVLPLLSRAATNTCLWSSWEVLTVNEQTTMFNTTTLRPMHGLRIQQGWSISCSDPNIIGWTELWGGRLLPWWVVESLNSVVWCKIRGTTDDVDSTLQFACPLCSCWSWFGKVGTFCRLVLTVTLGLDNSLIKLVMRSGTRQAVLQGNLM